MKYVYNLLKLLSMKDNKDIVYKKIQNSKPVSEYLNALTDKMRKVTCKFVIQMLYD